MTDSELAARYGLQTLVIDDPVTVTVKWADVEPILRRFAELEDSLMVELGVRSVENPFKLKIIGVLNDPDMGEYMEEHNETLRQLQKSTQRNSSTVRLPGGEPTPYESVERRVTPWYR